jgi:hypothetical protein
MSTGTSAIGVSKDAGGNYTARLPLSALMEGDTPPEEGDQVEFSVQGTVQSVQGDSAVVKVDSVNDEPVSEEAGETPAEEGQENAGGPPGGPPGGPGGGPPSGISPGTKAMGARLRRGAAANALLGGP